MNPESSPLLNPAQLADLLGVSPRKLRSMKAGDPSFPPFMRVGRSPRWKRADVMAWVDRQVQAGHAGRWGRSRKAG